ncbi:MAG TPA: MBOAT family O-acyltransferase, partial [Pseudomonadales bacterium]|nr:MBOAT family O-acyltransferase [Pseudomonadales bacterium]
LNHYALFVTFFPHLLAGPIVHHRELIPQFFIKNESGHEITQWAIGITVISFGLFKKLIMADALADYANQVFSAASRGVDISASEAWLGVLSFNLQVYFDFSGYCDIACGSALLFGITLPQNFLSPFKAVNIIDYWKYWHITLSRFITSYVYTPLMRNTPGGTLFSKAMLITLISMGISGLWHGANWTFIFWGLAHGALLVTNHCWRKTPFSRTIANVKIFRASSILLTYIMVTLTMVLFRSPDLVSAHHFYNALFDLDSFRFTHQIQQPVISDLCRQLSLELSPMQKILPVIIFMHAWVWLLPNLQQVMAGRNALIKANIPNTKLLWKDNFYWALLAALALSASIMSLNISSDFVYFQF